MDSSAADGQKRGSEECVCEGAGERLVPWQWPFEGQKWIPSSAVGFLWICTWTADDLD